MASNVTQFYYWKWQKAEFPCAQKSTLTGRDVDTEKLLEKTETAEDDNKRALSNSRLANRHMLIRTKINPYMANNDYLHDLSVQDQFLRPKDSNVKQNQ